MIWKHLQWKSWASVLLPVSHWSEASSAFENQPTSSLVWVPFIPVFLDCVKDGLSYSEIGRCYCWSTYFFLRTDHSKSILKDQLQFGDSLCILQLKILTEELGNPITLNLIHNRWSVLEKAGGPAQSYTTVIRLELFAYLPIKSLKFIKC